MPPTSRPSLAPFSRAPRSASRPELVSPAVRIWQRYLAAGALLGGLLSLSGLFGSFEIVSVGAARWQSFFLSAIFSAALAALLFGAVGTLVYAGLTMVPRLRRHAPLGASVVLSLIGSLYFLTRGVAEAFRLANASQLNLGTIEFLLEGMRHLLIPLLLEYFLLAALLIGTALVVGAGLFFSLRTVVVVRPVFPLLTRSLLSFALLVSLLFAFTTPNIAEAGGLRKTADLALLASVAARRAELNLMKEQQQGGGASVPRGPRRSAGELWRQAAGHLARARPNVVIVMMESVGTSHLGFEGYERPVTPNLDLISEKSVRFRNARSTATHSNYAQMAVLSSLFPRRYSGLDTYRKLNYPRVLWHDFLSELNYQTATYSSQDETWQGMIRFQSTETPTEFHHAGSYRGKKVRMGSESIVPDSVTATRAMQWVARQEHPFGLYVNFQSTHFPYRTPKGTKKTYLPDRPTQGKFHYLKYPKSDKEAVINRYDNALTYVDAQIGRLYDFLESTGRLENTILVITADHGELFWDHGMVTHGRSLFDAEARVPLIIHSPALEPRDEHRAVSTLDILPTVADLLGVPSHPAFQGVSLLDEGANFRRPVFMNIQGMKAVDAVLCGSLKLTKKRGTNELLLFDVATDPREATNLLEDRSADAELLHGLLTAQMRAQMAYHSNENQLLRDQRFAPRFAPCPEALVDSEASLAMNPGGSARPLH